MNEGTNGILLVTLNTCVTCSCHHSLAPERFHHPRRKSHIPWQPLTGFLSLGMCLFWTFHANETVQYVTFRVWLLSLSTTFKRFAHVGCIRTSFLFKAKYLPLYGWTPFCLRIRPLMAPWVISTCQQFCLLTISCTPAMTQALCGALAHDLFLIPQNCSQLGGNYLPISQIKEWRLSKV